MMKRSIFWLATILFSAGVQGDSMRFSAQPEAVLEIPGGFSCDLIFDLTGFQGKSTAHAALTIPMTITGSGYPMLRLFVKDVAGTEQFVAASSPNAGHKAAFFYITDFINKQLPCQQVVFRLEQVPGSGTVVSFIKNRAVTLAVNTEEHPRYDLSEVLTPIWSADHMVNETILPVSGQGAAADAQLLFRPVGNVLVQNYALDKTYQEGVDYVVVGNRIRLIETSSIPFLTQQQLYPDSPSGKFTTSDSCNGGYVAFQEKMDQYQVAVSYEHSDEWVGPVPSGDKGRLLRSKEKLQSGRPLKIALLGDSISFGASASKSHPPYLPGWGELLIHGLRDRFQSNITFVNPSRGGANSGWGKKVTPNFIVPETPDLFIIAFGMNDANATPVKNYIANIKTIMGMVSAENPDTEFILVASMLRNENWRSLTPMNGYLAALKTLETEHVAIADVWSVSEHILKTKRYCDISGNHVNHPNDFMVRVYAQVVGALLID